MSFNSILFCNYRLSLYLKFSISEINKHTVQLFIYALNYDIIQFTYVITKRCTSSSLWSAYWISRSKWLSSIWKTTRVLEKFNYFNRWLNLSKVTAATLVLTLSDCSVWRHRLGAIFLYICLIIFVNAIGFHLIPYAQVRFNNFYLIQVCLLNSY